MTHADPLLRVRDLEIRPRHGAPIVESLTFDVHRGETVGLVGESGCGKSLTALSVMGLLPENLRTSAGTIALEGRVLNGLGNEAMRRLRGVRMAMIYQEPLTALNPVMTVGAQIAEVLRAHEPVSRDAARKQAIRLLEMVRIPEPELRFDEYPHRMSGGMRQRVVIAIAIACNPSLLIADEPTTALDVTVQAQILQLLKRLQDEGDRGFLLITHDLGVVRQTCNRVIVMYAGSVVEEGPVVDVLDNPRHPYTAGLIAARPHGSHVSEDRALAEIPGTVSAPDDRPRGCVFEPRCDRAQEACRATRPPLEAIADQRSLRCRYPLPQQR